MRLVCNRCSAVLEGDLVSGKTVAPAEMDPVEALVWSWMPANACLCAECFEALAVNAGIELTDRDHLVANLRAAIEQMDQDAGHGMINWEAVEVAFETGTPESFRRQRDAAIQTLKSLSSYSGKPTG